MSILRLLILCSFFISCYTNAYSQEDDFAAKVDSIFLVDQFFYKCLWLGKIDAHQRDSVLRLYPNLNGQSQNLYLQSEAVKNDSLVKIIEVIRDNNFRYLKWAMENGLVKKMDYIHAAKFTEIIDHFSPDEFDAIDPLLQRLLSKKIIKPILYANVYDFIHMSHKLPQKYFVIFQFNKDTNKSCVQTPPDIKQTDIYRKAIGLKKWKPACRDEN